MMTATIAITGLNAMSSTVNAPSATMRNAMIAPKPSITASRPWVRGSLNPRTISHTSWRISPMIQTSSHGRNVR